MSQDGRVPAVRGETSTGESSDLVLPLQAGWRPSTVRDSVDYQKGREGEVPRCFCACIAERGATQDSQDRGRRQETKFVWLPPRNWFQVARDPSKPGVSPRCTVTM